MDSSNTTDVLNRIYAIHNYSLPIYLTYAKPWSLQGDDEARDLLDQIARSQQQMGDRLAKAILENGGDVESGEFPMDFTFYHDLSCDFLVNKVIEYQKSEIGVMEHAVRELGLAPLAKALVEECLGAAQGNLDSLLELAGQTAGAE
jgi:hypothetical protein